VVAIDETRNLSPEQIMGGIAKAVKAHDFEAVNSLLRLLAVKDPEQAEVVYKAMLAVLERRQFRASLRGSDT
jgi:hypothetical protein